MSKYSLLSLIFLLSPYAAASDDDDVDFMVAEKCTACHESEVYTRQDRKVKSLEQLGSMVRACSTQTGAQWFDDEVEIVIEFLNKHYYKFGEES